MCHILFICLLALPFDLFLSVLSCWLQHSKETKVSVGWRKRDFARLTRLGHLCSGFNEVIPWKFARLRLLQCHALKGDTEELVETEGPHEVRLLVCCLTVMPFILCVCLCVCFVFFCERKCLKVGSYIAVRCLLGYSIYYATAIIRNCSSTLEVLCKFDDTWVLPSFITQRGEK